MFRILLFPISQAKVFAPISMEKKPQDSNLADTKTMITKRRFIDKIWYENSQFLLAIFAVVQMKGYCTPFKWDTTRKRVYFIKNLVQNILPKRYKWRCEC